MSDGWVTLPAGEVCKLADDLKEMEERVRRLGAEGFTSFPPMKPTPPTPASAKADNGTVKPLTYTPKGGAPVVVGSYSMSFDKDGQTAHFKPAQASAATDGRPFAWLKGKIDGEGWGLRFDNSGNITVFMAKGDKLGPLLGWVAWYYNAESKEGRSANVGTGNP